jgi:hypothetical protein
LTSDERRNRLIVRGELFFVMATNSRKAIALERLLSAMRFD